MGKRELVALLNLSSWCLVMVERLFLGVPRGCLWFVILPDHTHLLFLMQVKSIAEHSAILSTFIKLPFAIKTFVLSIFEWPFYTVLQTYKYRKI